MRRAGMLVALVALGASLIPGCRKPIQPGDPLPGLTREQQEKFKLGRQLVMTEFRPETGLGPLFNEADCSECHEDPSPGGGGDEVEIHVSRLREDGFCDPLADRGGPVIQQRVTPALKEALGLESEPIPDGAMARASRSTPDLLGFGLLDSVSEAEILSYADPEDRNGDGISGRPNRFFDGRLGRFGRKAIVPTLREFNDGALIIEQGITTPAIPVEELVGGNPIPAGVDPAPEPEVDQKASDAVDAFVRFLAPAPTMKLSHEGRRGRALFSKLGCAACHRPLLRTGDVPERVLRRKAVAAYTDLLLHDMGPDLADICLGQATPSEFRTEPLMGLRLAERFLHDGRAQSIEQAIVLHGGEAGPARDRFSAATEADKTALIQFLKSL